MKVKKIKEGSKEYPENLKHIFDPPPELFVNGDILPSDSSAIAIVGTRRATHYGLEQCRRLSYDLAIRGITVVSGMAKGIDTAAHKGALMAGGRTIAVLGSGHGHVYPPENRKLYGEIAKNGAVLSEFPDDTLPFSTNFPKRNRVISGLSKGVVVIEAPRRSGALITVHFALEQGREVFAMPGNISSTRSNGTNALIKEGAKLVENVNDILEELKFVMPMPTEPAPSRGCNSNQKQGYIPGLSFQESFKGLSSDEKAIFGILDYEPKSIDEILKTVDLSVQKLSQVLLMLELKRLIKALPGENFIKV